MPIFWALHTYGFACLSLYKDKVDRAVSDVGRERMRVGGAFDNVQITKRILMIILDDG